MKKIVLLFISIIFFSTFYGCSGSSSGSVTSGVSPTEVTPTVSVSVANATILPGKSTTITIFAKDGYGRAANGQTVLLNSLNGGTLEPSSGEVTNGYFSTTYTAGQNFGTDSISAIVNSQVGTASIVIANSIGSPSVSINSASSRVSPGKKTTIAIYVSQDSKPAIASAVSLSSSAGGEFAEQSGSTNDSGWFTTTYTAPSDFTGKDTISAFALGIISTSTITIASDIPETVKAKITLFPDAVFTGQATLVSVVVTDSDGNPANIKASLACDLSGKWEDNSKEALSAEITNGFFQTDFTAGQEVGSATIYLNAFNGTIATAGISIEKPSTKIQLSTADTKVKVNDKLPISIFVSDELLRPFAGKSVLLTSSNGGQFLDSSDSTISGGDTNDSGILSLFYQAGNSTGTTIIKAYSEGSIDSKTITIW